MKTKDIIKQYFKDSTLEVLDKETSKGVYGAFPGEYKYGAVSLTYIHKYVLKGKVSIKFTAKKIAELLEEKYLLPLPCDFAKDLVFCNYEWSVNKCFVKFSFIDGQVKSTLRYMTRPQDDQWVNNFNKYLK